MKALMVEDVLLWYPDHNLPFNIYTDASDFQLGSVILQQDVPVAYYSRKFSSTQQNYTTIEKELFSIVKTLRTFCSTLLCAVIHNHTDHKKLTYDTLTTLWVLCWQLFVEKYHPTFHYIKWEDNVIANAVSHLPQWNEPIVDTDLIQPNLDPDHNAEAFSIEFDNSTLLQCLLYHPVLPDEIIFHIIIPYFIFIACRIYHYYNNNNFIPKISNYYFRWYWFNLSHYKHKRPLAHSYPRQTTWPQFT